MRRLLLLLSVVAVATLLARGAFPCATVSLQPSCYVALQPGPTADALELVEIGARRSYPSSGDLLLTTVAVDTQLDLGSWVDGILDPQVDQVRRDLLFPPQADREDIARLNTAAMVSSQDDATIAALRSLGIEFDTDFDGAEVVNVAERSAVEDRELQPGDVIVRIDGEPVGDNQDVIDIVARHEPGDVIELTVERGDLTVPVTLELIESPQRPGEARIGVVLSSHLDLPVDVAIDAGQIGGPSAGLMFALSIIDKLGEGDLTGGDTIAGTGEIDREGRVGPIGGIEQKIIGALNPSTGRGASVFLVPDGNVAEARTAAVSEEILLVPVSDLDDALEALRSLQQGREPADALALGPTD